jgi:hypothetical protein
MKTLIFLIALLLVPVRVWAQDTVAAARDLYASAAYDEALVVLNRLNVSARPPSDRLEVNQYRAFCLVALRRTEEAEKAIEAVVTDEPLYHPSAASASPRLISAFATVRQRVLPSLVQTRYAHAKAAFDRQDYTASAAEFDQVLQMINDIDLRDASAKPPLSDVRTLAAGFRDLSVRARVPEPVAVAAAAVAAPPALPAAVPNRIYTMGDPAVSNPVIVRQQLPPFPPRTPPTGQGVLEVVINEQGLVESATMRSAVNPLYDPLVLAAAKGWRYKPATVSGTPVKFRKFVSISVEK